LKLLSGAGRKVMGTDKVLQRGLGERGFTNFFWPSSTLGIFVVTLDDIDDEITLYRSIAGIFLPKETISACKTESFNKIHELDL
jgi:hypothetical protein